MALMVVAQTLEQRVLEHIKVIYGLKPDPNFIPSNQKDKPITKDSVSTTVYKLQKDGQNFFLKTIKMHTTE